MGIRLPWTLDNEDNWNHTHRFAGYAWIIAGVLTLLSVFLSHAAVVWVAAILSRPSRRSSIRSFTRKGTGKI